MKSFLVLYEFIFCQLFRISIDVNLQIGEQQKTKKIVLVRKLAKQISGMKIKFSDRRIHMERFIFTKITTITKQILYKNQSD